jgi:transient receptor potential cation channel subfamily M member 2
MMNYYKHKNEESRVFISDLTIPAIGIQQCRCNKFLPKEDQVCGCGLILQVHDKKVIQKYHQSDNKNEKSVKWNIHDHTIPAEITNAYGNLTFKDKRNVSKFIRIDFRTDLTKINKVLFGVWHLKPPSLILSITGGASSKLKQLTDTFKSSLIEAAATANAWIITGGTNSGVMKFIGEAIKDHTEMTNNKAEQITLIGIADWCTIKNNHLLIRNDKDNNNENKMFKYSMETDILNKKEKESPLDSNHSHFILVDNAQLNVRGGEIEFRTNFEHEQNVLVCVLVFGGGRNTFETVLKSVEKGSPCVFVEVNRINLNFLFLNQKLILNKTIKRELVNALIFLLLFLKI